MTVFTLGNICKEVQRIQYDLEEYGDVASAIDRCKRLDELLCSIEDGTHKLDVIEEMEDYVSVFEEKVVNVIDGKILEVKKNMPLNNNNGDVDGDLLLVFLSMIGVLKEVRTEIVG